MQEWITELKPGTKTDEFPPFEGLFILLDITLNDTQKKRP